MCIVSAWLAWKLHKACDDVVCADTEMLPPTVLRRQSGLVLGTLDQPIRVPKKTRPPIQPVANSLRSSSQAAGVGAGEGLGLVERQRGGPGAGAADDERRQAVHGRH